MRMYKAQCVVFDPVVRKLVETRLQDIADGLAQAYNMKINLNYTHLPGAVMNDEALTHKAIAVAQHVGYKVEMMEQPLRLEKIFQVIVNIFQVYLR